MTITLRDACDKLTMALAKSQTADANTALAVWQQITIEANLQSAMTESRASDEIQTIRYALIYLAILCERAMIDSKGYAAVAGAVLALLEALVDALTGYNREALPNLFRGS